MNIIPLNINIRVYFLFRQIEKDFKREEIYLILMHLTHSKINFLVKKQLNN